MEQFNNLRQLAQELKNRLMKKKIILLYAYNGVGKTRLSVEFKNLGKIKGQSDTLYFNAFTEDLFSWDNDLQNDWDRKLNINLESTFLKYILEDQGKENEIIDLFQYYLGIFSEGNDLRSKQQIISPNFQDNFRTVKFSKTYTAKNGNGEEERITEDKIKISKGEESSFIWSIFYTFLNEVILTKNEDQESFPNLKYIFIDDPVSSLDENHLIEVASNLGKLIRMSKSELKFIITTHNPLFYNVLYNELKNIKRKVRYSKRAIDKETGEKRTYIDTRKVPDSSRFRFEKLEDGSYELIKQPDDSPFAYHNFLRKSLHKAIEDNLVYKYHFNFLRNNKKRIMSSFHYSIFSISSSLFFAEVHLLLSFSKIMKLSV